MELHCNEKSQHLIEQLPVALLRSQKAKNRHGLLEGDTGRLLFLLEDALISNNEVQLQAVSKNLRSAWKNIASVFSNCTYSNGLTGFLAFIAYFNKRTGNMLSVDGSDERQLLNHCVRIMQQDLYSRGNYDFMIGATGVGFFLLDKNPGHPFIRELINYFRKTAVTRPGGICWKEPEGIFTLRDSADSFNLGMAHGILPVILFLVRCFEQGISSSVCRSMAEQAVAFLLSSEYKTGDTPFRFPSFITKEGKRVTRHGWCYGDFPVALVLLQCTTLPGGENYRQEAFKTALYACNLRDEETSRVEDAAICHGAAGLFIQSLLLEKIFGHAHLKETTLFWKEKIFSFSIHPDAPGGFKSPTYLGLQANPGFLGGTAGIGLTLLYENNPVTGHWLPLIGLPVL